MSVYEDLRVSQLSFGPTCPTDGRKESGGKRCQARGLLGAGVRPSRRQEAESMGADVRDPPDSRFSMTS